MYGSFLQVNYTSIVHTYMYMYMDCIIKVASAMLERNKVYLVEVHHPDNTVLHCSVFASVHFMEN